MILNLAMERLPLISIDIPLNVKEIGLCAFNSNELTSVTISRRLTKIEHGVFGKNKLIEVFVPNSVTDIGEYAFDRNPIKSASIPYNTNLQTGAFPDGVDIIVRDEEEQMFEISQLGQTVSIDYYKGDKNNALYV